MVKLAEELELELSYHTDHSYGSGSPSPEPEDCGTHPTPCVRQATPPSDPLGPPKDALGGPKPESNQDQGATSGPTAVPPRRKRGRRGGRKERERLQKRLNSKTKDTVATHHPTSSSFSVPSLGASLARAPRLPRVPGKQVQVEDLTHLQQANFYKRQSESIERRRAALEQHTEAQRREIDRLERSLRYYEHRSSVGHYSQLRYELTQSSKRVTDLEKEIARRDSLRIKETEQRLESDQLILVLRQQVQADLQSWAAEKQRHLDTASRLQGDLERLQVRFDQADALCRQYLAELTHIKHWLEDKETQPPEFEATADNIAIHLIAHKEQVTVELATLRYQSQQEGEDYAPYSP